MADKSITLIPAAYVFLRRDNEVLLQRRQNTGYMDGHWVAGAAGHIEFGETAYDAAVREAREELGIDLNPHYLRPVTVMHRTDGTQNPVEQRVDWFFTAWNWSGKPQPMELQGAKLAPPFASVMRRDNTPRVFSTDVLVPSCRKTVPRAD